MALSNNEIFLCGLIRKCLGRNWLMGVVITDSFDNVIISCSLLSNKNLWGGLCQLALRHSFREGVDTRPAVCLLDHVMMIRWRKVNYLLRHVIYWPCHQIMLGSPVIHTTFVMRIFMTLLARQLRLLRYYWRWHSLHFNCHTSKPVTWTSLHP
mgnify:CR=1 FL=1